MQNGVVMAAFGRKYIELAHRAAESLVQHNPGLEVDLFTDAEIDRGAFSRIHVLPEVWIRSKVDAMLQSRFERTLFLDADIRVLADLGDIFELLDRFDLAMTHDQNRNSPQALREYRCALPNSFPQLNAGVVGFRRSATLTDFLHRWKEDIKAHDVGKDQPSLREALWQSDLRLAVLPPEYNLWDMTQIDHLSPLRNTAPRILHTNLFVKKEIRRPGGDDLAQYIGRARAYKLGLLLAADQTLARRSGRPARLPSRMQNLRLRALRLLDWANRQTQRLPRAILPWRRAP